MKKVIALSLALVLALSLATIAFAANDLYNTSADTAKPDTKYDIAASDFTDLTATSDTAGKLTSTTAGLKNDYFSSDYFSVSYKIEKGAALLDSVKFDGGFLVVKFKANVALERPAIGNFAFKELKVKTIKEIKADATKTGLIAKNTTFEAKNTILTSVRVGYTLDDSKKLMSDASIDLTITSAGTLYKFKKDSGSTGVDYKDITLRAPDFYADVRVFKDEAIYLEYTGKADTDIVKAYPDADLTFIGFVGSPSFSANAKVEFSADKDQFIYEIKDGKVTATNLKWDDSLYAFTGKTRTLGKYVISDVELKAVAAEEGGKNPNTGR